MIPESIAIMVWEISAGAGGAMGLEPGKPVQWELLDRGELQLARLLVPPSSTGYSAKKTAPLTSYALNLEQLANLAGF